MSQFEDSCARTASLTNHDQPIHLPGSIQPHGILLAIGETELEILQVSNNTQNYLGISPKNLLGKPLNTLLDVPQIEALQQGLKEEGGSANPLKLSIPTSEGKRYFNGMVHRTAEAAILELEPTDSLAEVSFLSFYALVRGAIARMRQVSSLTQFFALVVQEIQRLTGFDRVMVYQFDQEGAGSVIAEAKRADLSPYLGLHYPATDIPESARELYRRCLLRFIPDLNAQPVELVSVLKNLPETAPAAFPRKLNNATDRPLDLSLSVLRSVDPCCIEYHQNMDVAAILVVPLIKEQKLWGLISCHHQTPKYVSYEVRAACEFLGQFVALELTNLIEREESDYIAKLRSLSSDFVESISLASDFREALVKPEPRLLDLVSASGAAVCLDDEITLVGATPSIEEIRSLIEWADPQVCDSLFCTSELPRFYPEAEAFKNTASSLLLLRISQVRRYYILWFRPEVIQTVNWAGNPIESIKVEADGNVTLCPRKSFERWQEIVRLTALPWKKCELDRALDLRNAIVGIVLSKAEELAKLNQELEHSNQELASFAFAASHDLKEPLRGIYNYSTILLEDYASVLDDEGLEYLQTVMSLSVRMEVRINALMRLSQLGQAQLHLQTTELNEVLAQSLDIFRASRQDSHFNVRIPRPLPTVRCDPVLTDEVFSNLLSNAFKYNDKAEPWVEIGYLNADEQLRKGLLQPEEQPWAPPVFYVQDNGIGIQPRYREIIFKLFKRLHSQEKYGGGAGAGLAIAKKIVERHGGRIWVESTDGEGSTFYFTLESISFS